MPEPRIEIELDKLAHNARKLTALYGSTKGICVTAVTKGVCGSPRIASAMLNSGIRSFGDLRIANIQKMREAGLDAQVILIRSPMPSEADFGVLVVDNSTPFCPANVGILLREPPGLATLVERPKRNNQQLQSCGILRGIARIAILFGPYSWIWSQEPSSWGKA